MRKIGFVSLALAAALLPSTMFAGRIDGFFATQDEKAVVNTNSACTEVIGNSFEIFGFVSGTSGGCTAQIFYSTPEPHQASTSALKGNKTNSSSKVSQSIFSQVNVSVFDTDGVGPGTCDTAYNGSAQENIEKCKASGSLKATEAGNTDTANSSSISTQCELGNAGASLVPTPTQAQIDTVVSAFDGRKDVKFASKDGKLQIKHKGVPLSQGAIDPCD